MIYSISKLKDCKEQAMQRININEMLVFKDLEVPDSDFDSGMGVIPNEPPITENENTSPETDSQDESTNTEDSTTQEPDSESEVLPPDTEAETDKENTESDATDETQGSDAIVGAEMKLKPL